MWTARSVGMRASYEAGGHALLLLLPSEEKMVEQLMAKKVTCSKVAINPARAQTIVPRIRSLLAQEPELKHVGQKARLWRVVVAVFPSVFLFAFFRAHSDRRQRDGRSWSRPSFPT